MKIPQLLRSARRPPADWLLFGWTLLLLAAIRMALWCLPFRATCRWVQRSAQQTVHPSQRHWRTGVGSVVWAVKTASYLVPGATCLTQALAAKYLLARRGQPADLRIGVAAGDHGKLQAHAWLEQQGVVLIGGRRGLEKFTPLPPLETA